MEEEDHITMRHITAELDLLSRSDGSACYCQGDTIIYTAIHGPGEVKFSKEQIDRTTIEVVYKQKVGLPGCAEKSIEQVIKNTCESVILTALHPRTAVTIVLQEMQDCGSLLACCLNAACLGLLDAAVPLKFMFAALNCIVDQNGEVVLDPTDKEERTAAAKLTFVFDSQSNNLLSCETKGSFTKKQFDICLALCNSSCNQIFNFYRDMIKKKLQKSSLR